MSTKLMDYGVSNIKLQFEYLYPHGFDCISIIVPSLKRRSAFILKVIRYDATILIFVTFLIFVVARIIIECTPTSGWLSEFLVTLGICLAQKFIKSPKSAREFIWVVGLLLFAFIAIVILSSISYKSLIEKKFDSEIDTFEQLANLDLNIFMTSNQPEWTDGRYNYKTQYFVFKLKENFIFLSVNFPLN